MKKALFLAFSFFLAFSAVSAQTVMPLPKQQVVTDGPLVSFSETKFDFGAIQEGNLVQHTFNFKNTGNQTLIISDVRVTCGCTTPEWTRTPVAPGQTGFITVQFNSAGKPGKNHKVITVVSNSISGNVPLSFITTVAPRHAAAATPN
jgi:hypothetical protein